MPSLIPWRKPKPRFELLTRDPGEVERFERLSAPIAWANEPFVGFGDSSNAYATLSSIKGATATAVRIIRQRIQGLELGVFLRRFVNGDWEDVPAFNHPLQRLFDHPTRSDSGKETHTLGQLLGLIVTQYSALGESYVLVVHDGTNQPKQLQVAQPGMIEPQVVGGMIDHYRLTGTGQGGTTRLETRDVVRFWEPDPYDLNSARGIMGRNETLLNMDLFANQHWAKFYQNDATPKIVFEAMDQSEAFPNSDQQEAVSASWFRRFHRIVGNRIGLPGWVKPGWKVRELASQNEAQHGVALLSYTRATVFESFGVPTALSGDVVDVNRAAAETTRFTFDQNTIEPLTMMIGDALTTQLAAQYPEPAQDVQLVVRFRPFIARDKEFDLRRDETDLRMKVRSINEVRAAREPELADVTWGDLPVGTMGEVPYTGDEPEIDLSGFGIPPEDEEPNAEPEDDNTPEITPEEEERSRVYTTFGQVRAHFSPEREWSRLLARDQSFTPIYRSRMRSVFQRQLDITLERYLQTKRSHKRASSEEIVEEIFPLERWGPLFAIGVDPIRARAFVDSATDATQAITGNSFHMTTRAREILQAQNLAHYVNVNRTTRDKLVAALDQGLAEGESTDQIARRIAEVFRVRKQDATRIARTEVATAVQEAQVEGYRQTGVVEGKQWNTSLDQDVRDSHIIEGQTRELSEPFELGNGRKAMAPAAVELPPEDRINCRCFITPVFLDETALHALGGK